MILGTWNLETYPSPASRKGAAMRQILQSHQADIWFLTELHAGFHIDGFHLSFCPPHASDIPHARKVAIASRRPLQPIEARDHPAESRLSLARLTDPESGKSTLAVSTCVPWRGATPAWRAILGQDLSYAEVYEYVLTYFVSRIREERRPDEAVVWGGDFNQGLYNRDYVGTLRGRQALADAFAAFDLRVPTMNQPALIEAHPAIDHIAIPTHWPGDTDAQVHRPMLNGKNLSDHALYLVQAESRHEDVQRTP